MLTDLSLNNARSTNRPGTDCGWLWLEFTQNEQIPERMNTKGVRKNIFSVQFSVISKSFFKL